MMLLMSLTVTMMSMHVMPGEVDEEFAPRPSHISLACGLCTSVLLLVDARTADIVVPLGRCHVRCRAVVVAVLAQVHYKWACADAGKHRYYYAAD
jgi:hypothetical protein